MNQQKIHIKTQVWNEMGKGKDETSLIEDGSRVLKINSSIQYFFVKKFFNFREKKKARHLYFLHKVPKFKKWTKKTPFFEGKFDIYSIRQAPHEMA